MAHIQQLARKRHTSRFFGQECQIADMAHDTLERQRVEDENGMLRAEIADLKREQQITAECDLVAPKDGPTWGDAAIVAVSALVIAWLLVDSAWSLL